MHLHPKSWNINLPMFPWHFLPTCKWPSPAGLPMSTSDWISLEFAIDSPQISRGSPNESGLRPRVAGRNEHQTLRERWIGCRTAADDDFWSCGFGKKGLGHQKRGAGTPQNIHAQISAMLISLHHVLSFSCYGLSEKDVLQRPSTSRCPIGFFCHDKATQSSKEGASSLCSCRHSWSSTLCWNGIHWFEYDLNPTQALQFVKWFEYIYYHSRIYFKKNTQGKQGQTRPSKRTLLISCDISWIIQQIDANRCK